MQHTLADDLRGCLCLAWRWAWLLALFAALGGVGAWLASRGATPIYQASTLLLVDPGQSTRTDDYSAVITGERLAGTYTQVLVSGPVLAVVIDKLDLQMSEQALRNMIQAEPLPGTQLIRLQVQHPDPQAAALIANLLAQVFAEQNLALQLERHAASRHSLEYQLAELDGQIKAAEAEHKVVLAALESGAGDPSERDRLESILAQYRQIYTSLLQSYEMVRVTEAQSLSDVSQIEPAVFPSSPVRPRTLHNTMLGALVGLVLAVGVVSLVEALDDTLKTPQDVTRLLGVPVLGVIARYEPVGNHGNLPVVAAQPGSPVAEAFRALRTNVLSSSLDRPLRTLLVTSPSPGEGKTSVAANLAISLAQGGCQVVLLDADLRTPHLHHLLGLPNRQGLGSLFAQPELNVHEQLQKTAFAGLRALTTGRLPANAAELLGSQRMFDILSQLQEQAGLVILDAPPLLSVTDAAVLAPHVDGVLMVIKPGRTRQGACRYAVEQLRRVGGELLGVALNDFDLVHSRYRYSYYQNYSYPLPGRPGSGPAGSQNEIGRPSTEDGELRSIKKIGLILVEDRASGTRRETEKDKPGHSSITRPG